MDKILPTLFVFLSLIAVALGITCFECNVWKAGYGNLCDAPRLRSGCVVCMKTETTIFMGYYKNTPRTSTVTSRVCGKSKNIAFSHECQYFRMSDGHSKRCYCDTDLCNAATRQTSTALILPALLISVAAAFKNLYL